jgi:hypothetical protein
MSILSFCKWLALAPWSIELHGSQYAYPVLESVHVWALCLFLGMTVTLDLRLAGLALRRVAVSEMVRRLLPWSIAGFTVMVASGILLFFAIPVRSYQNLFSRIKLVLLIAAGINVWFFHTGAYRRVAEWDLGTIPRSARVAGIVSLVLWCGVVIAGRLIAYNWFDCDKPQGALVKTLEGCDPQVRYH